MRESDLYMAEDSQDYVFEGSVWVDFDISEEESDFIGFLLEEGDDNLAKDLMSLLDL